MPGMERGDGEQSALYWRGVRLGDPRGLKNDFPDLFQVGHSSDLVRLEVIPLCPFVPGFDKDQPFLGVARRDLLDGPAKIFSEEFGGGTLEQDPPISRTGGYCPNQAEYRESSSGLQDSREVPVPKTPGNRISLGSPFFPDNPDGSFPSICNRVCQ